MAELRHLWHLENPSAVSVSTSSTSTAGAFFTQLWAKEEGPRARGTQSREPLFNFKPLWSFLPYILAPF